MDELKKALAEAKPTLVELYKPTCTRCTEMTPVVEELKQRLGDRVNIIQIDGTDNQEFMREYKVASYPCWLLFKDGVVAWRDYGVKHLSELEHMMRDFI